MYTSKMMYLIEALRDERITPEQYHESMRRIQHEMDKEASGYSDTDSVSGSTGSDSLGSSRDIPRVLELGENQPEPLRGTGA